MIQILTQSEMMAVVSHPDSHHKYGPVNGLFLSHEQGKWVACDNSTGDAWTEEFDTLEEAVDWLNGEDQEEEKDTTKAPVFDEYLRSNARGRAPEAQRPKKPEPPKPKDPFDRPATVRDLMRLLIWYFESIQTELRPTYLRQLENWMRGEPNA